MLPVVYKDVKGLRGVNKRIGSYTMIDFAGHSEIFLSSEVDIYLVSGKL